MKAIEFVKKYGIEEAIKVINLFPNSTLINIGGSCVSVSDLKQIVDAFELVDRFGGYDSVLNMINNPTCFGDSNFEIEIKLNEAINLVEQCQND